MRFRGFYFRLAGNRHNLRAQNLAISSQPAEGMTKSSVARSRTATLPTRLSAWSKDRTLQPAESRELIRNLIEARYTLPE